MIKLDYIIFVGIALLSFVLALASIFTDDILIRGMIWIPTGFTLLIVFLSRHELLKER